MRQRVPTLSLNFCIFMIACSSSSSFALRLNDRYKCTPYKRGAFGRIFRCLDEKKDELVAIKQQRLFRNGDLEVSPVRESQILKSTQNLQRAIHLRDFFIEKKPTEATYLYLVMDFVEEDLAAFLKRTRESQSEFTQAQLIHLVRELYFGVTDLHRHGIMHRDLKPQNILVDTKFSHEFPQIKIADFGLARELHSIAHIPIWMLAETLCAYFTPLTQGVCTLWYRPLELLEPTVSPYGFEVDFWSLGMTIIEVFQGRPTATEQSSIEQYKKISKAFLLNGPADSNDTFDISLIFSPEKFQHVSKIDSSTEKQLKILLTALLHPQPSTRRKLQKALAQLPLLSPNTKAPLPPKFVPAQARAETQAWTKEKILLFHQGVDFILDLKVSLNLNWHTFYCARNLLKEIFQQKLDDLKEQRIEEIAAGAVSLAQTLFENTFPLASQFLEECGVHISYTQLRYAQLAAFLSTSDSIYPNPQLISHLVQDYAQHEYWSPEEFALTEAILLVASHDPTLEINSKQLVDEAILLTRHILNPDQLNQALQPTPLMGSLKRFKNFRTRKITPTLYNYMSILSDLKDLSESPLDKLYNTLSLKASLHDLRSSTINPTNT